jgi:hypothetical protein
VQDWFVDIAGASLGAAVVVAQLFRPAGTGAASPWRRGD